MQTPTSSVKKASRFVLVSSVSKLKSQLCVWCSSLVAVPQANMPELSSAQLFIRNFAWHRERQRQSFACAIETTHSCVTVIRYRLEQLQYLSKPKCCHTSVVTQCIAHQPTLKARVSHHTLWCRSDKRNSACWWKILVYSILLIHFCAASHLRALHKTSQRAYGPFTGCFLCWNCVYVSSVWTSKPIFWMAKCRALLLQGAKFLWSHSVAFVCLSIGGPLPQDLQSKTWAVRLCKIGRNTSTLMPKHLLFWPYFSQHTCKDVQGNQSGADCWHLVGPLSSGDSFLFCWWFVLVVNLADSQPVK